MTAAHFGQYLCNINKITMRYIDSWLTGLGLDYIIPKLKANGITTPKKLAQLTLRDMYEVGESTRLPFVVFSIPYQFYKFCCAVGVEDTEDRKKLYFLIQRLHTVQCIHTLSH